MTLDGLQDNFGVHQSGGPDNLLHHTISHTELVGARGSREIEFLAGPLEELIKPQRPVVHGAGQTETVFDQGSLARRIALIHSTNLGNSDVGFVNDSEEVLGEVIQETAGSLTGFPTIDVARIVFNTRAEAQLLHHFDVITSAHPDALGL